MSGIFRAWSAWRYRKRMKTALCIFVAAAELLAALTAPVTAAKPPHRGKLPAVFVGRWCVIHTSEPSDTVTTYHRAPCAHDDGKVTIRSGGFERDDVRCKALAVAAEPKYGNHHHLTRFWCEASDGRSQAVNYWISVDEKGVLTIQETEREP
jgi:hypothetical protein